MNNKRILIIDDEQANLDFFDLMLSRLGFEVIMTPNAEVGLEMIRQEKPDLIILDNIMPNLTGWEITRIVKEESEYKECRNIPIIMFSAMDDVKDKIEGFELGIDDYITKPFNFSEVLARIRAVLRSHELSQQIILREKRQSLTDSLNKSLIFFTEHLKAPVLDLLQSAKSLELDDINLVEKFRNQVIDEGEKTLAALGGLEDEVRKLQESKDDTTEAKVSLEELEDYFRTHFRELKDNKGVFK